MKEDTIISEYERLRHILGLYGQDIVLGMFLMVTGLLILHWFIRRFKIYLKVHKGDKWPVEMISAIVYFFLLEIILNVSLVYMGLDARTIVQFMLIIGLGIIALVILLRRYFPVMPFHDGNVVFLEGLLGKVEATNLYHTQLKTFDGKTAYIPNKKILQDVVINYHHTPGRRIKINVRIPYEENLIRAKQILEAIMIADGRVLKTPRPQVWVLDLDDGSVALGARCWAGNAKYWVTKCELTEKIKLRFDREGIQLALPRRQVYLRPQCMDEAGINKTEDLMPLKEPTGDDQ